MYQKPEMRIYGLSDEDIITTSTESPGLKDEGDVNIDDVPEFVWPSKP